jgi:hypothetical protein
MFSRRLPLAVVTVACLIVASGASADPLDTFTAAAAPSHVKPSASQSHTVTLTSDQGSPNRAQRAVIGIPAGFTVDSSTVEATTTGVTGSCDPSAWEPVIADQQIRLQRPGADTNALCPGATLTVAFSAEAAAAEGAYSWTSELLNESTGAFTLSGSQPSVVVDGTAPTATIDAKPGNPSNDAEPSFTFSAAEPSTFECKLDGAAFAPCGSPHTYSDLADGDHAFAVRATDVAGNIGAEAEYGWRIDTVAPRASIGAKPANPSKASSATFTFTASEGGSGFLCSLDGAPFTSCLSPKDYHGLGDGLHSFEVKATDQAGNTGPVDAFAWSVDTVAPTASIEAKPPNPSNESSASFSFSASEGGASFSCSLDGSAFAACVSVQTYPALADGAHAFAVRATDTAANTGTPATYTWTIDTAAPAVTITQTPSDPSNVTAPSFSFTATEGGSTFSCQLDAGSPAPCASPKSYPGLADGFHAFTVRATDLAGNHSAEKSYTWTIDTVAPTATITLPPSDPSNDTTPAFSFVANEGGSQFECRLDAAPLAACTSPHTSPVLVEGGHTFAVRATDLAGNAGPEATYDWTVDTTAPTATIDPTPGNPSNDTSPTFGFSAGGGAQFECKLDDGGFQGCTSPKTYLGVADGAHTFVVKATDSAGNASAPTSFSWTIDTIAPTATITLSPSDPSNVTAPSFSFTAGEDGSTLLCSLDSPSFSACESPKSYSGLSQGIHTFKVKSTDPAGNTGQEATYSWRIDTLAPTTTIGSKPTHPSASSSAEFSFAASESGSNFSCRLDGEPFAVCLSPKSYAGLGDGFHTFAVKAKDAAGNEGEEETFTWRIDTTAPTATITGKPTDPTNESSASFSFTSEPGSSFSCRRDGLPFSSCSSPRNFAGLSEGNHTFEVRATDALGNVGAPAAYGWRIDTVPPSVQITEKPSTPSNQSSPSFSFAASEPGSAFACRLEQGGFAPCNPPKSFGPLTDGQHAFAVRATDAAGNTGAAATHTWTIDTVAPTASITVRPGNPSNNGSPSFAFTANEDGSTFACRLDGGASTPCTSPTGYGGLGDGPHSFQVSATDPAGNGGPETTYLWTIETRGPTAVLISAPSGLSRSSGATFVFSADEPASFDCNLDGHGFEPCGSPATYHGLGDGAHAFSVRARDVIGNLSPPVGHPWVIDTTAPETTIHSAPSSGKSTAATFSFAATEGGTFECQLDGAPFARCAAPKSYNGLSRGDHQFQVRAIDAAGNVDATPALRDWKITAPVIKKVASALLSPKAGARVARAPLLAWRRVARARYYNVQLYRGSRKIFSAWPKRTRIQLRPQWRYRGRTYRLVPGSYRWYVWPGYGPPSARRYGSLLGQSSFVMGRSGRR